MAAKLKQSIHEMNDRLIDLTDIGNKRNFEIEGKLKNLATLIAMKQAAAK